MTLQARVVTDSVDSMELTVAHYLSDIIGTWKDRLSGTFNFLPPSGLNSLISGVNTVTSEVNSVKSGVNSMTSGVKSVTSGVNSFTSGVKSVTSGVN